MKKITLKKKQRISTDILFDNNMDIYFSGFCITDNENFAEFYIRKFPKLNYPFKRFEFDEDNFKYETTSKVMVNLTKTKALFDKREADRKYFDYFINKYKLVEFFKVERFMGFKCDLVGIFDIEKNRLVGLIYPKESK